MMVDVQQPIIARIDGGDVEVGGLLEDLHRETTRLAQIVQAQRQEIVALRASLASRERTIAGLEAWINDAREALQRAEAAECAYDALRRSSLPPAVLAERLVDAAQAPW
jgi:cell division septum initiation protein DivIVA